ncbi:MAG: class I SAM-dependent methyltransferase [Rhizomicrobium sp.]
MRELDPAPGARIVEVGCGTARNLIRIAKRYPGRRCFGLDASQAMLETAQAAVDRAGMTGRITLAHGYAEALAPELFGETEAFDDIIFSYSLSMIPDWKQALSAAVGALSPRGRIHIVDFADLNGLPSLAKRALLAWLKIFHVEPRAELFRDLEKSNPQSGENFRFLSGRYAFLLSGSGVRFVQPGTLLRSSHRPRIKPHLTPFNRLSRRVGWKTLSSLDVISNLIFDVLAGGPCRSVYEARVRNETSFDRLSRRCFGRIVRAGCGE